QPEFSEKLELDLATVEPSLSGPLLPQERVALSRVKRSFRLAFPKQFRAPNRQTADVAAKRFDWEGGAANNAQMQPEGKAEAFEPEQLMPAGSAVEIDFNGMQAHVGDGAVVIAAITSCTNTSNPSVMIGAGLLAKKAV